MTVTLRVPSLILLCTLALAGCAGSDFLSGSSKVTTASVAPAPKVDPVCQMLAAKIDELRKDGVEQKVDKAAARKYKLKRADITKVNDLTKVNAEFRANCSTLPTTAAAKPALGPQVAAAPATAGGQAAGTKANTTAAAAVAAAAKKAP